MNYSDGNIFIFDGFLRDYRIATESEVMLFKEYQKMDFIMQEFRDVCDFEAFEAAASWGE